MSDPAWTYLPDNSVERGKLRSLRDSVAPILASNFLPHFTDHSVAHSDHLCELVDQLVAPMPEKLTITEAFVIYQSCYLHDVGMHHAKANETGVVMECLKKPPYAGRSWESLDLSTRQEIVRLLHFQISGEMILQSVRAASPPLGITLEDSYHPGKVRAVCVAHGFPTDSVDYKELAQDSGNTRISLLASLLRIADILDESRRRSLLHLEKTRDLPLDSRLHWWRHYYVSEVTIDRDSGQIILWFDFPSNRRDQYRLTMMQLQMPNVTEELARHGDVLAKNALNWRIISKETPGSQCIAQAMDEELERYSNEQYAKRHRKQLEAQKLLELANLKTMRPTIIRSFEAIEKGELTPDARMLEYVALAKHLGNLGGTRDAWMMLSSKWGKLHSSASTTVELTSALDLAEMMVDDNAPRQAVHTLDQLRTTANSLADTDVMKFKYYQLLGAAFRGICMYKRAISAFENAKLLVTDIKIRSSISADIAEMQLLQLDLSDVINTLETDNA
jgi:hypothetical protein